MSKLPPQDTGSPKHPTQILIERVIRGDPDAWPALDKRFRTLLRVIAADCLDATLRPRVDQSDLAQSALIQAACSLKEFQDEGPGSLEAWLRKILLNCFRQRARYHGAQKRDVRLGVSPQAGPTPESREDDPELWAELSERRALLLAGISELSESEASIVVRKYFLGETTSEIARALGKSESTLRTRLGRAIRRLRSCRGLQ